MACRFGTDTCGTATTWESSAGLSSERLKLKSRYDLSVSLRKQDRSRSDKSEASGGQTFVESLRLLCVGRDWLAQVRAVENVEKFRANPESDPFVDGKYLSDA